MHHLKAGPAAETAGGLTAALSFAAGGDKPLLHWGVLNLDLDRHRHPAGWSQFPVAAVPPGQDRDRGRTSPHAGPSPSSESRPRDHGMSPARVGAARAAPTKNKDEELGRLLLESVLG